MVPHDEVVGRSDRGSIATDEHMSAKCAVEQFPSMIRVQGHLGDILIDPTRHRSLMPHDVVTYEVTLVAEVVPFVVEFEVAVPRLTPASW